MKGIPENTIFLAWYVAIKWIVTFWILCICSQEKDSMF